QALQKLQQQVDELASLLAVERRSNDELRSGALELSSQLKSAVAERDQLSGKLRDADAIVSADKEKIELQLREIESMRRDLEALNAQVATLRDQLSRIAAALDVSEAKVKDQQGQIVELGKRLNLALVNKVEELARYRSEFFGRLREILGDRADIRIVGDRFVFQSEVLFAPGSAELGDDAKKQLAPVIGALKEIAAKIPPDINWILRVDGHTDHRPISSPQFPSNWELSTARAISV